MTTILILLAVAALNAWMAWELANTPSGYEDSRGFHYNKREKEKS